jgi:hypothetical protein
LILECLNTEKGIQVPGDARFKHWAKAIFRKTTIGEKEVLICLKPECPVVTRDEAFEVISKCNARTEHSGRDKTWHEIKRSYAGIRYPLNGLFIETCSTCSTRKPLKKPTAGKPIISIDFCQDEYILVQDGMPIAKALHMAEMLTVHNFEINQERRGVSLIKTMLTYLNVNPTIGNNFGEFISVDQFVP